MTVAELLGVPSATFARKVDVEDGALRVERQTEGGYDVVTSPLPALVTVTGAPPNRGTPRSRASWPPSPNRWSSSRSPTSACPMPTSPHPARVLGLRGAGEVGGVVIEAGDDAAAKIAELLAEAKAI